jgi:serine/threonine protein kinase
METERICPNCKKPLPVDVPLGLCPECLVKSGFNTGTEPGGEARGFVPPAVEEIAKLFPQFEIFGLIGKGGMGAVYKARQKGLDRMVAVKILPPHAAGDPGFVERFNREARALARLNHPNIVAVYEFGTVGEAPAIPPEAASLKIGEKSETGKMPVLPYLVMEFVDGTNLREVERAGRLAPEQALLIVPQICEALQFAHGEGVVHRDIKPENILLDKKGRVKITDFGIAKMVGVVPEKIGLTGAKDIVGTPHYMAPEQVERPNSVDHRADIYSLGVVFYELLTGELPMGKFAPPSRKVQVDVRLDDVVLRALEKEPERRYQQASEVKTAVETIAGTPPVFTAANQPANPANPPSRPVSNPPPVPVVPSRFSRTAIAGAAWSVFSVVAFLGMFAVRVVTVPMHSSPRPSWAMIIAGIILVPLGLTAPFGTTILGWIAMSQIRRSAGRLYGMALAVFDGLIFPLLVLDGIIAWAWWLVSELIRGSLVGNNNFQPLSPTASVFVQHQSELVTLATLVTAVVIDVLIVWLVWRAVRKPLANAAPARSGGGLGLAIGIAAAVVGVVVLAGVLGYFLLVPRYHSTSFQPQFQIERPGVIGPPFALPRPPLTTPNAAPPPMVGEEMTDERLHEVLTELKSSNTVQQIFAATELSMAKRGAPNDEIETLLIGMLTSTNTDWTTHRAAAAALGVWGTEKSVEPLIAALDDSNVSIRWAAINSLAKMNDPRIADALAKHLVLDQDRVMTANTLQSLGAPAESAVIPLLQDKNPQVRRQVCQILMRIGTTNCVPALSAATNDSDNVMSMLAGQTLRMIRMREK